jgi:putative NADPH-quinone reductase
LYPLWLGSMPALLKAFLEQVFRPGFATAGGACRGTWKSLLAGKSARIVVTIGMPAFIYRWYFRAHRLKSLERNILGFCGIGPA